MLFAKVRFHKVYLVFLFSVLSFNFSNCFTSQDIVNRFNNLDVTHKIEVGLAAGKLPTAILADLFAMQDKKNTALVLKSIALALDVSNLALKTYNHIGDVSSFQYGYGIYDLVGIWNGVTDLMSNQNSKALLIKNDLENLDKDEVTKSYLKQLAYCLLKYSFLAADSATSIAFTLDEEKYGSYRNMYSWMNCWSKVLANSIKTKDAKVSSKVPVYLAGALISALFSNDARSESEIKGFVCRLEGYVDNYKKEKDLIIKCFQSRVDGFLKIEKDSSKTTEEKQEAKSAREKDEKEIEKINKRIRKFDDDLHRASNKPHVIKIIEEYYPGMLARISSQDPDFMRKLDPTERYLSEQK